MCFILKQVSSSALLLPSFFMFVTSLSVIFTTMCLNIFITRDHLISFKRITKNSEKLMDNWLIMSFSKLQKVSLKNATFSQKWTNTLKYRLFKIKINNFQLTILKTNKLLVYSLSTKLKPRFSMQKVNSTLSIILMIFWHNKKILFNSNAKKSIILKNLLKNRQLKDKLKNKLTMLTKDTKNKTSEKHLKRLILDMSLIKLKEFQKNLNKFSMFVICKNKMVDAWF